MINIYLTVTFAIEICLKLIGLGYKKFLSESMNLFDSFVIVISLLELALL